MDKSDIGAFLARRDLLVAGGSALLLPATALAKTPPSSIDRMIIINALGGIDNPNAVRPDIAGQGIVLDARAIGDAKASGLTAVNLTLGYYAGPDEPFEQSVRDIAQWDACIRRQSDDLCKILTAQDIITAKQSGRIGIIYGFQNAAMIGLKVDRVRLFADLGVRIIQLTYNIANEMGSGALVADDKGLTVAGAKVVAELNDNRVIVDLSHSGRQTCLDATRASVGPVAISHTGCRAVTDLPRNKSDEELRLIASKGGFVGIYFMPFVALGRRATAEDVVNHIDHAVNVCGEDHVGIGTDGDVTSHDDMDAYMAHLRKENAERRAAGISAPGEGPDVTPFIMDLRGPDQFHKLARLLTARGYNSRRIEKILGGNFLSFAREVWGG